MKIFKKLLSTVLASTMVVGMSVGAWANGNREQTDQAIDLSRAADGFFRVHQTSTMQTRNCLSEDNNKISKVSHDTVYYVDDENTRKDLISSFNTLSRGNSNNNYKETLDSTCSYKMYTTLYFTESKEGRDTYCTIDKVKGGYEQRDWTVKVVKQSMGMGQVGGLGIKSFSRFETPKKSSWTYYAKSDWEPVKLTSSVVACVGCWYDLTIKRNAGSWNTSLENYAYNDNNLSISDIFSR